MQGDNLYSYPAEMNKCPTCNHPQGTLFVLAETEAEADKVIANGGGLCGECMCDNIIETHGQITTRPLCAGCGEPIDNGSPAYLVRSGVVEGGTFTIHDTEGQLFHTGGCMNS